MNLRAVTSRNALYAPVLVALITVVVAVTLVAWAERVDEAAAAPPARPLGVGDAFTNWDVFNYCSAPMPAPAYRFNWLLEGVQYGDVLETYAGGHPFARTAAGGTPTPFDPAKGINDAAISWVNDGTPVAFGDKAHFGYILDSGVPSTLPSLIRSTWLRAGTDPCEIPEVQLRLWNPSNPSPIELESPEQPPSRFDSEFVNFSSTSLLVTSKWNTYKSDFALSDLVEAHPVSRAAAPIGPELVRVDSRRSISHTLNTGPSDTGLLMIYEVANPSKTPIIVAYHAIELERVEPTETRVPTREPSSTPTEASPTPYPIWVFLPRAVR